MGGSKPTPPTIIMPEESNPQAFQTIIPQKSYKDLAESMRRTEGEINRVMGQRYDEVGTPQDIFPRFVAHQEDIGVRVPQVTDLASRKTQNFDSIPVTLDESVEMYKK